MEKYMDIIRRVLELADTCLEGLEHAEICLREGRFEDCIIMLHDAVHGYYQMEKALVPVLVNLSDTEMAARSEVLRNVLDLMASLQERGEMASSFNARLQVLQQEIIALDEQTRVFWMGCQ